MTILKDITKSHKHMFIGLKNMKIENTFMANIYVGFREGYGDILHTYDEAEQILQEYCNTISYCVTITKTKFIYKNGDEDGVIIGLINYPRFPSSRKEITSKAKEIAYRFLEKFAQNRISVVCSDQTYLIDANEKK